MEEEEIVRGAQALAAVLRVAATYLGTALLLFILCRSQVAILSVRGLGCTSSALLWAIPLTLGVEGLVTLVRRVRRA
jgi:uncharacterized membrane protein